MRKSDLIFIVQIQKISWKIVFYWVGKYNFRSRPYSWTLSTDGNPGHVRDDTWLNCETTILVIFDSPVSGAAKILTAGVQSYRPAALLHSAEIANIYYKSEDQKEVMHCLPIHMVHFFLGDCPSGSYSYSYDSGIR